jgi:hypothetical protein
MAQQLGIILRTFLPYKSKISILTKENGKIDFVILRREGPTFSPGSLILFEKNSINLVNVPSLQHKTISWLHHIIEVSYYFTPYNLPCPELYQFILNCFELDGHSKECEPYFAILKRACRIRLLILLGFYPDEELVSFGNIFEYVVSAFLDSNHTTKVRSLHVLLEQIPSLLLDKADKWVLDCLHEHPYIANFKTISFFDSM